MLQNLSMSRLKSCQYSHAGTETHILRKRSLCSGFSCHVSSFKEERSTCPFPVLDVTIIGLAVSSTDDTEWGSLGWDLI